MSYHSLFFTYKSLAPFNEEGEANLLFPMIVAMTEMGMSGSAVRAFAKDYQKDHVFEEILMPTVLISSDNWQEFIGQKAMYPAFVNFFEQAISQNPEKIRDYFAPLSDRIFGYDFGLLIRLAYAFESGQKEELARALAFLAVSDQKMTFQLPEQETKVFVEQIEGLKTKQANYQLKGKTHFQRFQEIMQSPSYLEDFAKLEEENLNIFTLRAMAIRLAREVKLPIMKLLFCAVHAFRVISPLLPDLNAAIQQFYMVIQALYLSLECPLFSPAESGAEKTWFFIFQLAGASKDIFNLLFIYSCFKEYQFAESSIYNEMAYAIIHQEIKPQR